MNKIDMALEQVEKLLDTDLDDKNAKYGGKLFPFTVKCLKIAAMNANEGQEGARTARVNEICEKASKEQRISLDDFPDLSLIEY
jgi:hypothetical protein